jgi:hypothetical protein
MICGKGNPMDRDEQATGQNVSLYDSERAMIYQVGKDYGLRSFSAALRFILNDWARLKARDNGNGDRAPIGGGKATEAA